MKTVGIIAEYDPFHKGHLYHMERACSFSGADAVVVIMSGAFTQRGQPAMFDKKSRAAMAVEAGADLVIELPYVYACSSSQEFAYGGVKILNSLGCADYLSFGCETDDYEALNAAADVLSTEEEQFGAYVKKCMKTGISYSAALSKAVENFCKNDVKNIIEEPNNILAIEYIKTLNSIKSEIQPVAVKREGPRHNASAGTDDYGGMASASLIRKLLRNNGFNSAKKYLPESSVSVIESKENSSCFCSFEKYESVSERLYSFLRYRILTSDVNQLKECQGVAEGIENKMKKSAIGAVCYEDFIAGIKSKRYTRTRLNRICMNILMGYTRQMHDEIYGSFYARILGIGNRGSELLKIIKKNSDIPLISNMSHANRFGSIVKKSLEIDSRAAEIRNLLISGSASLDSDLKFVPYIKNAKY